MRHTCVEVSVQVRVSFATEWPVLCCNSILMTRSYFPSVLQIVAATTGQRICFRMRPHVWPSSQPVIMTTGMQFRVYHEPQIAKPNIGNCSASIWKPLHNISCFSGNCAVHVRLKTRTASPTGVHDTLPLPNFSPRSSLSLSLSLSRCIIYSLLFLPISCLYGSNRQFLRMAPHKGTILNITGLSPRG
jgi:hypothetical protein